MSTDVVDLTSSPEDGGGDRGRKRGRDEETRRQDNTNGSPATAAASSASDNNGAKRRRIVAAPLKRSGGAKATGESDDGGDVVCLDDSSSSDDDERKPAAASAAAAAKRKRRRPTNRNVEADEAIDLTSTSPRPNEAESSGIWAYPPGAAQPGTLRTKAGAAGPAATASSAAASAAAGPSPFATQATAYLDSVRGDLCHDKKQEHFEDARRPEQTLRKELSNLWDQLRSITDRRSEEYRVCRQQIDEMEAKLHQARKNAAEDIYNRNNSAERMGRVGADGRLTVDYHGLYKRDAIDAYETMVLPILPVQTRVAIITGKGRHSKGGRSALRDGLLEHIRRSAQHQERKIECRVDPKNDGILLVDWIGEA